ncbi:MAG: hypothetical protein H6656_17730 [Ardenticatenaceae bacterium]|nr:hypothetical protein [Ardenticatenaceae bacterium]
MNSADFLTSNFGGANSIRAEYIFFLSIPLPGHMVAARALIAQHKIISASDSALSMMTNNFISNI